MHRAAIVSILLTALIAAAVALGAARPEKISPDDWPWWRGPNGNGIAAEGQTPPVEWSPDENIVWKAAVPGRGHGSPTVVGDQVFLATADEKQAIQWMLCFDRATGEEVWRTEVHRGGLTTEGNKKSTQASSTPACDGEKVFINFLNNNALHTTALTRDGEIVWQTKISDYVVHQGYGASPAIYGSLVLVSADNKGGGAIAGLDRESGEVVWKHARPDTPNYASPIVVHADGKDQLIFIGCDLVASYEPISGEKLWEIEGATTECVTSTVTDGEVVISSGGYPDNHVAAIRADGSGETVWRHGQRVYVPSMIIKGDLLLAVTDDGIAMCWECATGEELWKKRLGGTFSSSPVLAAGHLYATNEAGRTLVLKPSRSGCEIVAENELGNEVFATPSICGSRIYHRVAEVVDGERREFLYCIGQN